MNLDATPNIMSITEDPKKTSAPPRPPREGVGLVNAQRNTVMIPSDRQHIEEDLRPKSQMPIRNQSVPFDVTKEQLPERAPSRQVGGGSTPSPVNQNKSKQQAQLLAQQQQAQKEAQLQAQREAQQQAQREAQEQAQREAQQQAQREAQQQAQREAQLQAQREAQQQAQREAQQLAQREAQQLAQREAHQLAQREAQQQAQREAQQQAQLQAQKHAQQNNAAATAAAVTAATAAMESAANEEREHMLREIQAREAIIAEMKKKENWWRTEVSIARKHRNAKGESFDEGPDADESLLMDVDHLSEDKVKLFEQLVSVKSELRRVRGSILQQAQPMSDKVSQADRMRTAALQEAAYFKSKYLALKSRRQDEMNKLEVSRSDELEKRLAVALSENEANSKLLLQLQKQSQHDQTARHATEERARDAQTRAEEAQQAHQRALEELQVVYARATKAEVQVRDNAVKIADLTQQLSEALRAQPAVQSHEITDAHLKASQLEAANLKARNETAHLKQKLAEQLDDIARLKNVLQEREDQLSEAKIHVEDYEIQLSMMRETMNQQPPANGYASTKAY
jgi:hypothetical protein